MTERPRIAIAPARKLPDYVASIEQAGGEPWVIEPDTIAPRDVLRQAAGVLLLGGGDVDPALYGEAPDDHLDPAEPGRDEYEIELVRQAVDADMPLLAICRGVQVMNVALGGTLVQDIPSQVAGALTHRIPEPKNQVAHRIIVSPDSLLARVLPEEREVNSRHHQSVKQPGDGLLVSATAPDGVIEALEHPSSTFVLGVQWHPENFVSDGPPHAGGRFLALFKALVEAAHQRPRR